MKYVVLVIFVAIRKSIVALEVTQTTVTFILITICLKVLFFGESDVSAVFLHRI